MFKITLKDGSVYNPVKIVDENDSLLLVQTYRTKKYAHIPKASISEKVNVDKSGNERKILKVREYIAKSHEIVNEIDEMDEMDEIYEEDFADLLGKKFSLLKDVVIQDWFPVVDNDIIINFITSTFDALYVERNYFDRNDYMLDEKRDCVIYKMEE